jgi:protein-ribulosamine 3-kinase
LKLPQKLVRHLEEAHGPVVESSAVGGGCISNTTKLVFAAGEPAFLKWAPSTEHPRELFIEEARSLRAIAETQTVRVPNVIEQDETTEFAWLVLEWLEPGPPSAPSQAILGEQLAAMHRNSADEFGWPSDNFIGSLPQSNRKHERWFEFWRDERLLPQIDRASQRLIAADRKRLERVIEQCAELLGPIESEGPSLLHGDLWGGNLHTLTDGTPALIDPSSYYGHREVDLAMSRLFGGFSQEFYRSYQQAWPCNEGLEQRLLVYQLYYLLVHVNLFGGGYAAQTMSVVTQLGC